MITNCNVPRAVAANINVIVPVHPGDVVEGRQWYTRILYNHNLPFTYSLILDTHVFPCYRTTYSKTFKRFIKSNVDVAISNRMNVQGTLSGAAVLTRQTQGSRNFWEHCIDFMRMRKNYDDQAAIIYTWKYFKDFKFRQLSSNWFFSSHGVLDTGVFFGAGKCYRSSVVVTGPVQWVHAGSDECQLLNGKKDEYSTIYRAYFKCRLCTCNATGPTIATSAQQLASFTFPNKPPQLIWKDDGKHHNNSLFWY